MKAKRKIKVLFRNLLVFTMAFMVATPTLATAYATYANIIIEHIWDDGNNKGGQRDEIVDKGGITANVTAGTAKEPSSSFDDTNHVDIDRDGDGKDGMDKDVISDNGSTAGAAGAEKLKGDMDALKDAGEEAGIQDASQNVAVDKAKEEIGKNPPSKPDLPEEPEKPTLVEPEKIEKPEEPKEPEKVPEDASDADKAAYEEALAKYESEKAEYAEKVEQYYKDFEQYEKDYAAYKEKVDAYQAAKDEYDAKKEQFDADWAKYLEDYKAYQEQLGKWHPDDSRYGYDKGFKDGFEKELTDEEKAAYEAGYQAGLTKGENNPVAKPEVNEALDKAIEDVLLKKGDSDDIEKIEGETTAENKWSTEYEYGNKTNIGDGLYIQEEDKSKTPVLYWAEISEASQQALKDAGYTSVLMKITIETVKFDEENNQSKGHIYVSLDGGKTWNYSGNEVNVPDFNPTTDCIGTTTFTFLHSLKDPEPPKEPDVPDFDPYKPPTPPSIDPIDPIVPPDPPKPEEPTPDIPKEPVPLAPPPEEEPPVEEPPVEEIPDPDVPLADVPQTGDTMGMWTMLALLSAAGLLSITRLERKRSKNS